MSSQLTRKYWAYLHDQVEYHERECCQAIYNHPYQDEMRVAAETYDWLAKEFSLCFATAVSAVGGMEDGLNAEETSEFLQRLDQKIEHFTLAQEQLQHKKQAALTAAHDWEYHQVRRTYQEMENLTERETAAYRNSRQQFLRLLEDE